MKFAFASALLAAAVFADATVAKTDAEHETAGKAIVKAKVDSLKADNEDDKKAKAAWAAWLLDATNTPADKVNVYEALTKEKDGNDLDDAEKKALKAYTDIFGGAYSLAMAGVATLGAVFLL